MFWEKRVQLGSEVMPLQTRIGTVSESLLFAMVILITVWIFANASLAVTTTASTQTESGIYSDLFQSRERDSGVSDCSLYTLDRGVNAGKLPHCVRFATPRRCLLISPNHEAALSPEAPRLIVQGNVSDAQTHEPISKARVILDRRNLSLKTEALSNEPTATAVTDEKGFFRLERIEPGPYRLSVLDPAYVPLYRRSVELSAQDLSARLDVSLDPMVQVVGKVVDELDRGIAHARLEIAPDFQPLSDVLRLVLLVYGKSAFRTKTGSNGEFEIFVPRKAGTISLIAQASGYVLGQLKTVLPQSSNAKKRIILRLSRGWGARGRVIDDDGAPIAGATILAVAAEAGKLESEFADVRPQASSGTDGSYVLWGLVKGAYELRVSEASHLHRSVLGVEIRSAQGIILPDIVLGAPAEIRGRVIDIERQPIVGARVTSDFAGTESSEGTSDEQGGFLLRGFAKGAKGNVSAAAPGYATTTKAVSVPSGDMVLVLQQSGVLRGRVEDAETGIPIKDFRIRNTSNSTEKASKSNDGGFEWAGIPIGSATFVVEAKGYQATSLTDVEIRTGEPTEVIFSLVKGAKLTGRIVEAATGAGIPDATVTFRGGPEIGSAAGQGRVDRNARRTGRDGSFEFDNLPFGKVMILAAAPLHHAATQRIVIAGEESFVEIKLSIEALISGRVFSPDGTHLPARTTVWLASLSADMSNPSHATQTDAAGMFSFDGLAAGAYRLTAEAPGLGKSPAKDIILREDERQTGLEIRFVPRTGTTLRVRISGLFTGEVPWLSAQGEGNFEDDSPIYDGGNYVIPGVPAGVVKLAVATSSQRLVERSVEISRGAPEITFEINFPREAQLSGRVTKAGRPVGNQTVTASSSGPNGIMAVARTDPSGVYAIEGLSDGEYRVTVEGGRARVVRVSGKTVLDIELP